MSPHVRAAFRRIVEEHPGSIFHAVWLHMLALEQALREARKARETLDEGLDKYDDLVAPLSPTLLDEEKH